MSEPCQAPHPDADRYELTCSWVYPDGTRREQVAVYQGNPATDRDALLISGPDLRHGAQIFMNTRMTNAVRLRDPVKVERANPTQT